MVSPTQTTSCSYSGRVMPYERPRVLTAQLLLGSMVLLSACGAAAEQKQPQVKSEAKRVSAFGVAGITPGMTASQVSIAASRAGYRMTNQEQGPDWVLHLRRSSGAKFEFSDKLTGVSEQTYRRGGEDITVTFIPMPQGPVATDVHYSAPLAVLDFAAASAELTRRYGSRSFAGAGASQWAQWCSKGVANARACLTKSYLSLEQSRMGVTMHAANPLLKEAQRQALLKSAGAKPSF